MQDFERPAGATTGDKAGDEARKREAPISAGPAVPRSWSDEEKVLIAQESFERDLSVVEVAERHGVPVRQLSLWGKLLRKGKLVVPPNPTAPEPESPFAAVAVESA
ncbi:MAG: transposase [Gammaproteobacteria bacterium]|nr:transposase [Gammaproteobacteria bacterium]